MVNICIPQFLKLAGFYNQICLRQAIRIPCKFCVQKLLVITIPSCFLIFITYCHYAIISYVSLTNYMLTDFRHPLCILKHITFWSSLCITYTDLFLSALHWPAIQSSYLFSLLLDFSPFIVFASH